MGHVRDAVMADDEVARIEGKAVDDDDEEDDPLVPVESGGERKKKKKADGPKEYDDVTGFEVDENSTSAGSSGPEQGEKWKEEAQRAQEAEAESVMHAATNYVKKIPTK